MTALVQLFPPQSVASSVLLLAAVSAAGLAAGAMNFFGVRFGIAAVMFSGILFGHLGFTMHPAMLALLRDFGLILFVYSIGAEVGPGFFAAFRRDGLKLNLMAVCVTLAGSALALLASRLPGMDLPLSVGMYAGAVTNTPALAAAQQTLAGDPAASGSAAVGYALAFPVGTVGVILVLLLLKRFAGPAETAGPPSGTRAEPLVTACFNVEKVPADTPFGALPLVASGAVAVSRVMRGGKVSVAAPGDVTGPGDIVMAVGRRADLDAFGSAIGSPSACDLSAVPGPVSYARILVTRHALAGRRLADLGFGRRGVVFTRVARADVEFLVPEDYKLQLGDNLAAVGGAEGLAEAAAQLGNSPRDLNRPRLVPVFIGLAAGVLLGSVPIPVPGLAAPVKLGLAGGPLVAALVFSWLQTLGPLSWYMPPAANLMLRELGIVMFFSCVGLECGGKFFQALLHGNGLVVMGVAAAVSVLPALAAGWLLRRFFSVDLMTMCGSLAAATTNPPALAFSDSFSRSGLNTVAYATVYPLAMILRIVSAQLLLLIFR